MRTLLLPLALVIAIAPSVYAWEESVDWKSMEQHFTPPAEFAGKLGDYRSLMIFDDGSPVKTPQDWPRRRKEILDYWHSSMGAWPALVAKPRIEYKKKEHVENFTRHEVEVEIAPGRIHGPLYLLVPDGKGPFPAVLITWYNSTDSAGLTEKAKDKLDFGYQLAKRGFVTLCVGGVSAPKSAAGERGVQPLSYLAYVAANCANALANLPEVDPARIGVTGHSFGGKWAMFASCLSDRFACAVWIDPGVVWNEKDSNANYWEKWYLGYDFDQPAEKQKKEGVPKESIPRTGAYRKFYEEKRDMHELHALMAPRPFLVSGGAQDRPVHWLALNHAIALNKFLGHENRVAMTMRDGHNPTPQSNAQLYAFFEHFLKKSP